ncbi:hypothetical protein K469DRAFT_712573 [Zopfia rhizophila CBS 207.26]|uniref:Uncharacterized protein n=1 Tax=Zopfia rhizophila CBS 207.26 TaxID=1314779 RepID=A0A6A6ERW0_9PEZI|nr:hypothetical protein K469DRAFT_712573 [Zopfia rhizophila CBS 207.26]
MSTNPRKRRANVGWQEPIAPKAPRLHPPNPSPYISHYTPFNTIVSPKPRAYKPTIRHQQHPDSGIGQNFHWVPYPLGLMPYDSWYTLHNRQDPKSYRHFRCPVCQRPRKITPHIRKTFLVAERLSWEDSTVSMYEKAQNEEMNWEVNYELGILDPFVEDPEQVPGGKRGQSNQWYPYQNQYEMQQVLNLIFMTENITEMSWTLWISAHQDLQRILGAPNEALKSISRSGDSRSTRKGPIGASSGNSARKKAPEMVDLTMSPDLAPKDLYVLPTPPSSHSENLELDKQTSGKTLTVLSSHPLSSKAQGNMPLSELPPSVYFNRNRQITSFKTLQDFYSLLDQIERTSYVGAQFLEAYAEHLRDDLCRDCWLSHNVDLGTPKSHLHS